MVSKDKLSKYINEGHTICSNNQFYNSLRLLLRYFFLSNRCDINLLDLTKNVSKSEMEYKVFMVYKNFALDIYYTELKPLFDESNYDDIIFGIIYLVKTRYDENHKVLSPYIEGLNNEETIKNYNFIKSTYTIEKEQIQKINNITEAIILLEESRLLENKAKEYKDKALSLLYQFKNNNCQLIMNEKKLIL